MPTQLSSDALIDVVTYKAIYGVSQSQQANDEDEQITRRINGYSRTIINYCGQKFRQPMNGATPAAIDEIFSGKGISSYWARNRYISGTPVPKLYYLSDSAWVEATSADYKFSYNNQTGEVYFTDGHIFPCGNNNWKFVYSYGYTIATMPDDLKNACADLVYRAMKRMQGKEGVVSESFGDQNTSFNFATMPDNIKDDLMPYVRKLGL